MTKRLLAALATVTLTGTSAHAQDDASPQFFFNETSPEVVETVIVNLSDAATGGCWTNLGEAKTYAEDQLRLKGYEVTDEPEWGVWRFVVEVFSERDSTGCTGMIEISLFAFATDHGTIGSLVIGRHRRALARYQNVNVPVLDAIKEAIDQFPER